MKVDEDVTIHSFTADPIFHFECSTEALANVNNGMTIAAGETVIVTVFIEIQVRQLYTGKLYISTSIGDYEVFIYADDYEGIGEKQQVFTIFPNPANDFVLLKGESLGTVNVYNALGQKVEEFVESGDELRINTAQYENGVYFVKTGGQTLRFVVTH